MKKTLAYLLCGIARLAAIGCLTLFTTIPAEAQVAYSSPKKIFESDHQAETRITLRVRNEKLGAVLEKIEKQINFVFVFSNDEINISRKVTLDVKDKNLGDVLKELLSPLGTTYEFVNDKIILKPVNAPTSTPSGGNQFKNI